MNSGARLGNHPLHPMLVPIPIGLFIFSLVADAIFYFGFGDAIWNRVAFYTMVGGIVGAAVAAVPGFIDFQALTDPRVRRIAVWHMTVNSIVITLYAINLWLRWVNTLEDDNPVWLSVIAVALLGVSGWLGAHMVYVHGAGVAGTPAARDGK
jgi:uncharacterized membrane protein